MRFVLGCVVVFGMCGFVAGWNTALAAAESPGQADLDRAFEARLSAKSIAEVGRVIDLCRDAIKKGLDDDNKKFAEQLLASSLFQRGEILSHGVLDATRPDPRLPQLRLAALSDLEEALELDDQLWQAHVLVARLNLFAGADLKKARAILDKVVAAKTADAETRSEALTYRSTLRESLDERLADLDEAVRLNADAAQAYRLRAAVKLSRGQPAEAVADFDAALRIEPDHPATHEARGLALAAQKKWGEAKESLNRAVELFPQASGALLQRSRVNLLAGNPQAAVADADAVLKLLPDLAEALLLRSHAKYAAGDKAGALADVDRVLERAPNAAEALRTRVGILVDEQRTAEAVTSLERLAKLEPEASDVVVQWAALENSLKHNRRAVELLDPVVEREPKNWRARRIRADALLGQSKHHDAVADYEAALEIEPKDSGLLNNLAWVLATSPDDSVRNGKRAVELAEAACRETQYKEAHILSTLAAGYAEQGDFAAARKWSEKALDVATEDERAALGKELESYRAEKPWRESLQETAESNAPERK
jgi:tetratricopeptide (TPR) repeat protein